MTEGYTQFLARVPEGDYKERLRAICEWLSDPSIVHSPAFYEAKGMRFSVPDYTPYSPGETIF